MKLLTLLEPKNLIKPPEYFKQYEGENDEFGFSSKTVEQWLAFFQFLYQEYFKVYAINVDKIPEKGRVVLAGNHSGVLPIDGFLTSTAVLLNHKSPRRIRYLAHNFLLSNRYSKDLVRGFGGVPATYAIAKKLLENEELVFFYPEGTRGIGKPFSERYRICDFDTGFVKAAIATGSPIVPVITVGGDEIYPCLANLKSIARLMDTPYWPVTPTFPLLPYITSCLPMPVKFLIEFGEPIYLNYPPERCSDKKLRLRLAREIQYEIQRVLNSRLRQRKSPFSGWEQ